MSKDYSLSLYYLNEGGMSFLFIIFRALYSLLILHLIILTVPKAPLPKKESPSTSE